MSKIRQSREVLEHEIAIWKHRALLINLAAVKALQDKGEGFAVHCLQGYMTMLHPNTYEQLESHLESIYMAERDAQTDIERLFEDNDDDDDMGR